MKYRLVGIVVMLVMGLWASTAPAQPTVLIQKALEDSSQSSQPTTRPATQAAAAAVVTTQPVSVVVQAPQQSQSRTLTQVLEGTRFGKLVEGQQVSLNDLRNPGFWIDTVRDFIVAMIGFVPRLLVAFLFLLIFWVLYRGIRRLIVGSMKRANVDSSIRDMLGHLVKWTIMGFGLVIACNQIGIQIAALLTGVSIIGLAIGFAAQETLANFIAGVVIFWDKPFRVGDWIEIDETFGQVQRVTFRSTRILALDGDALVYPNTHMLSNRLSNHTTHPLSRVNVSIGIAYKESISTAREVLLGLVKGDSRIVSEPAPTVVVDECASSSINLLLRFWIEDEAIERPIRHEYLEKAKNALDAAGISIPFPHMQVLMEEPAHKAG